MNVSILTKTGKWDIFVPYPSEVPNSAQTAGVGHRYSSTNLKQKPKPSLDFGLRNHVQSSERRRTRVVFSELMVLVFIVLLAHLRTLTQSVLPLKGQKGRYRFRCFS